jgi:hypothetical protein
MRSVSGKGYGFELANRPIGDGKQRRTVAVFRCAKCHVATLELNITTGDRLNPNKLANTAKLRGWEADAVRKQRAICPLCLRAGVVNDPTAPLKKLEEYMAQQPSPPSPIMDKPVVPLREPTPDQRAVIRTLLEKNFDEEHGYYVGGYSDQRVAEEANVPRLVVERLRDAAYGPIKVSPEVMGLREDMETLRMKLDAMERDAAQWTQEFGREVEDAKAALRNLSQRLGNIKIAAA